MDTAGRWALLGSDVSAGSRLEGGSGGEEASPRTFGRSWECPEVERYARALLRRYGVVFRRLLLREPLAPPWRDLVMVYRSLEARGELRGGRFLTGFTGEQFALPEAVSALRAVRREPARDELVVIAAADPLNLTGVVTPGERIPGVASTRVAYRAGVPVLVRERGQVRSLTPGGDAPDPQMMHALARRRLSPSLRTYVGRR